MNTIEDLIIVKQIFQEEIEDYQKERELLEELKCESLSEDIVRIGELSNIDSEMTILKSKIAFIDELISKEVK